MPELDDQQARARAVDPDCSVIVQAPAGSGKTTLLVERYLALLTRVEQPEAILAITFTRKAAAEMRERVLKLLDPAYQSAEPHEQRVLAIARSLREAVARWQLRENPHRLLIRTIDSFNHYLTRTMPVASQLGPVPDPADDAIALYREAARRVLQHPASRQDGSDSVTLLLAWQDHHQQRLEGLLAGMLAQRDQWRRAFSVDERPDRAQMEALLATYVGARLESGAARVDAVLKRCGVDRAALLTLLGKAGERLSNEKPEHPFRRLVGVSSLPTSDVQELPRWIALAEGLLTGGKGSSPTLRKAGGLNKNQGFPPKEPDKKAMQAILQQLEDQDDLVEALRELRSLPQPAYTDEQWRVLDALIDVLIQAAVQLQLVAAERNQTDYAGIADAALRGLGDDESGYTDLSLYLDSQLKHLLVDEFQDTNRSQFALLEKLVAGWEPGDGRTLFLVGDPMQSIYRFREAEVGLFLQAREQGIGDVRLESLKLHSNFRSREEIVGWVNDRIGTLFPKQESAALGTVRYEPSTPGRSEGGTVTTLAHADREAEARAVTALLAEQLAAHEDQPGFRAAIIVRARSHLNALLPALDEAGLRFRAVKLDRLMKTPVAQDLLAISRTLMLPTDNTAWLALLRSPVAGLALSELLHITAAQQAQGLPLPDASCLAGLSEDAQQRAASVLNSLAAARNLRHSRPFRDLVEGVWRRLGGPLVLERPVEHRDAEAFLDTLSIAEASGELSDWNRFEDRLSEVTTEGDPPADDVRLEVLTMHGAKGLEWDLVVLPALERKPAGDHPALLHWLPFQHEGQDAVLLAPLRGAYEPDTPALIRLLRDGQKQREQQEVMRLLYVAATRAREQLILSVVLEAERDADPPAPKAPAHTSLAGKLWKTLGSDFSTAWQAPETETSATAEEPELNLPAVDPIRRLPSGWCVAIPDAWRPPTDTTALPSQQEIDFDWAGQQARRVGTVLHRLLERVGRRGIEHVDDQETELLLRRIEPLLLKEGESTATLEQSREIVHTALERTLASKTGRWLLSSAHEDAACELNLAAWINNKLTNGIIDRTFIAEDGRRWIIDYKSGYHDGGDLERFLAQERDRYRDQLKRYRQLFEQLEERPIVTALYLPRHDELIEVDA